MALEKNVPTWERVVRTIGSLLAIAVGIYLALSGTLVWGIIIAASGLGFLLTAAIGWCPMCAMVGRKLPKSDRVINIQKM